MPGSELKQKTDPVVKKDHAGPKVKHGEVRDLPIGKLVPNDWNPNEMNMDEFNMLSENIDNVDFLDPVLVVPIEDGMFRIVDGEHRWEASRIKDFKTVKCVIADPDKFDLNTQKFQTVRMNKIHGQMNQEKFGTLVKGLMESGSYSYDELAHEFGFADEDEFEHLIAHTRESLPTVEMQAEFDKAKNDIKTVDDLSLVLNRLFTRYGDTLPYHFMVMDFGGKDHMWVRMNRSDYRRAVVQARNAMAEGVTFDSLIATVLSLIDVPQFVKKQRDQLEKPDRVEVGTSIDALLEESA